MKKETMEFYNFLQNKSNELHKKSWDAILAHPELRHEDIPEWRDAKSLENLMGVIMRKYIEIHDNKKPSTEVETMKSDAPISIVDYIDPMNTEHMKGYLHMQLHGTWSERFRKKMARDQVTFPQAWNQLLDTKLADHWIKRHLRKSEYENVLAGRE